MDDCIFCKIVKGEIPCFKVYEDDLVLAFADINPMAPGHVLVIPKVHAESLWEIPEMDLAAVHMAARKIALAMRRELNPLGVACLQLNGRGANQLVPHYHLHLIPRLEEGPELPVTNWELKPGDMDAVGRMANRIARAVG